MARKREEPLWRKLIRELIKDLLAKYTKKS